MCSKEADFNSYRNQFTKVRSIFDDLFNPTKKKKKVEEPTPPLNDDRTKLVMKNLLGIASADLLLFSKDTKFVIGKEKEAKEFSSEDLVSKIKSPAFNLMFTDKPNEANIKKTIELPEIKPDVFITFLNYIYCNEVRFEFKDLVSTYQEAIKYEIDDLPAKLLAHADENVNIDSAVILYDQYLKLVSISDDLISSDKLNELVDIINLHTFLVIQSKNFTKISQETLIKILESDKLIAKEKDLYYASVKWIKAELKRKGLEDNLDNEKTLFSTIKHLIRFSIMKSFEFSQSETGRFFPKDKLKECPAKSGLLTDDEIQMLLNYFETKDSTVLSNDFNKNNRCKQNIGVINLEYDKEKKKHFWRMSTNVDDILEYGQRDDMPGESYHECTHNVYDGVIVDTEYQSIKPKKLTKAFLSKTRAQSMVLNENSIKVFRIGVTGSSSGWDYGSMMMIFDEKNKIVPTFYKRYSIDNYMGYYSYLYPVEIKKNVVMNFNVITPGEGTGIDTNKFKLENIYRENSDGETELDVKCELIDGISWEHPHKLHFLYK